MEAPRRTLHSRPSTLNPRPSSSSPVMGQGVVMAKPRPGVVVMAKPRLERLSEGLVGLAQGARQV